MYAKIVNLRNEIKSNRKRIVKLKRNANYTQKCKEKKKTTYRKLGGGTVR